MTRPKGSKNKSNEIEEKRYTGIFLIDSGLKVPFDISEINAGNDFEELETALWPYNKGDIIWLGEGDNIFLRADKVIGWQID